MGSYGGFANAELFVAMDDDDIRAVEEFVRNKLPAILLNEVKLEDGVEVLLDAEKMREHFGELFASNPSTFQFVPGDKKFIQLIQKWIETDMKTKGEKRATNPTEPDEVIDSASTSIGDLEHMLYTRTHKQLTQLRIAPAILRVFNESFVSVAETEDGNISGGVYCVACYVEGNDKGKVHRSSVFLRIKNGKPSWIISNFTKHVKTQHKNIQISSDDVHQNSPAVAFEHSHEHSLSSQNVLNENILNGFVADIEAICGSDGIELTTIEKIWEQSVISVDTTETDLV